VSTLNKEPAKTGNNEISRAAIIIARRFGVALLTASVLAELALDFARRQ
jgi:hypothetical protein